MVYLYNFIIFLFEQIIFLLSFFKAKVRLFREGRKETFQKLQKLQYQNKAVAWFHVASLGEFEQARPLLEAFRQQFPQFQILLTFFSPSGYEVRKNYPLADCICYLPLDKAKNVKLFLDLVNPKIVFFIKYEFWYHFLTQLKSRQVMVFSVSAIFRNNHIYFKNQFTRNFYKKILGSFTEIFVQDELSAELLKKLDLKGIVTGDTRFDRVKELVDNRKEIPLVADFCAEKFTLVVGSSWKEDWNVIGNFLNNFEKPLKIIVAPHEIEEKNLIWLENFLNHKKMIRFSEANSENIQNFDILLIDNYGMLTSLYQYANLAYVGGAFGKGLHNVLEPSVYGIAVIFGKKYDKFREVVDLVKLHAVFSIQNETEFAEKFNALYKNTILRKTIRQISEKYIAQNIGATQKILDYLKKYEI